MKRVIVTQFILAMGGVHWSNIFPHGKNEEGVSRFSHFASHTVHKLNQHFSMFARTRNGNEFAEGVFDFL